MKKRILFILVIGVSFAPPVFARGLMDLKVAQTGENDQVGQGASYCEVDRELKIVDRELNKIEAEKSTSSIAH